jgi:hypothetical protein
MKKGKTARDQASASLRELLGAAIRAGTENEIEAIVVMDEQQCWLAEVPAVAGLPSALLQLLKSSVSARISRQNVF